MFLFRKGLDKTKNKDKITKISEQWPKGNVYKSIQSYNNNNATEVMEYLLDQPIQI